MANVLISYYSDYGEAMYDAITEVLLKNGNNVFRLNINNPAVSITRWGGDSIINTSILLEQIKDFNPHIILNFNNSLPQNCYEILDKECRICILDADNPETFWNQNFYKTKKNRYLYLGFQSYSKKMYESSIDCQLEEGKNYLYFPPATVVKNQKLPQNKNISFIGSNLYPYSIPKELSFYNINGLNLYHLFKNNFFVTLDEARTACPKVQNVEWLYEKVRFFTVGQERLKYLQTLVDLGLNIFGNRHWEQIAYYDFELANCHNEMPILTNSDNQWVYNTSKISINISHPQARSSFSWRVMDIMASNSCLLTEDKPDWRDLFEKYLSKETLDTVIYTDRFDMREKAKKLLSDNKLRQRCITDLNRAIEKNGRWEFRLKKLQDFLGISLLNAVEKDSIYVELSKNRIDTFRNLYKNKSKIRICAIVHTEYTNTYDTLFYETQKDNRFEWIFVLVPFKQDTVTVSISQLEQMMKEKGYPYLLGYNEKAKKYLDPRDLSPDIVLLQTPYDKQRISPLYSAKYLGQFSKCFHISYGCSIVDYDFPPYTNIPFFQDKSCTTLNENTEFAKILDKYKIHPNVPIGYIKCDKYLNYKNNQDFKFKERPPYEHIIVWKPRWLGTIGDSNFITYLDYFISFCRENKNCLVFFILHDLLKNELVFKRRIFTENCFDEKISQINAMENIKIINHGDFLDDVFNADIFVGDYCSTIMEFTLTGKPVIYTPTEVIVSEYGKKILEGYYIVHNKNQMDDTLKFLLSGTDPLKKVREKIIPLISDKHKGYSIAQYCLKYFLSLDFSKDLEKSIQITMSSNLNKRGLKKYFYKIWKHLNKQIKCKEDYKKKHPLKYKIWKHLDKKLRKKGIIQ